MGRVGYSRCRSRCRAGPRQSLAWRTVFDKRSENERTRPEARGAGQLYGEVGAEVAIGIASDDGVPRVRGAHLELPAARREVGGADVDEGLVERPEGVRIDG